MPILYDKLEINKHILLDLPFREGAGVITQDVAKPHHPLTLQDPGGGSFYWGNLATGYPYLGFNTIGTGVGQGVYLDCPAAQSIDLNFTTGSYSIGVWFNWLDITQSSIIIGKYWIDAGGGFVDGWEIYLDVSIGRNTVSQRHNHASLTPNMNSNCYSVGWTPGTWWFLGISRVGGNLYPIHYRNGVALDMNYGTSGMLDPDSANRDLVIGCRCTKDANWFRNKMGRVRVWNIALTADDWKLLYELEKGWFA